MKRKKPQAPSRLLGCTVTWRDHEGVDRVVSEAGGTLESLEVLIARTPIPPGGIRSISTWHSIRSDITRPTRHAGATTMGDPYCYERSLLTKIGRPELLCAEAAL